ncbi:hypothetical protein B0H66DRAFT_548026 [Apodospora peruviana]|uniref:RING-type E3 ubiquitin transferase n=1 Tax=Apodospora peruviana TaxID=516989 RepID=A0AAE0MB95_9PEZI|nr:hypothetical protein B0H66DRAFT_548026 [Apodospora peruviana]
MQKMRLAWYAAASTALAGAVVVSAFHQRANFYSAMVHLAQSSLSLLVLANLVFVVYGSLVYGLQRLCFGPLRPTEIEQLYEKAWFAVTETCLAMTIFREEVGAFFLVMFTALVTGKVWGWIGEGRVEVFEQQPPANPRLFHARLSISLFLSVVYDIWLLSYAVNTVVQQARPTMMVMFLFEFAVLTVCSLQTALRYVVSLVDQQIVKVQTRQRLEQRRREVREQREELLRRREAQAQAAEGGDADAETADAETADAEAAEQEELPNEEDVDEMDIEVPGWESKGFWVLSLDLIADLVKLCLYTAFFCILFTFYGLPIHIIRDWFMTARSFLKRLSALIRYRQALKDMDQYPDATPEDLGQEDTCIICREEMRPWDPADATQVERTRAKKLPCGHILHFGCLKSWLERQQVCPTCRRPVVANGQQPARNGEAMVFRLGLNFPAGQNQQPQPPANGQAPAGAQAAPGGAPNNQENNQNQNQNNGVRMFNLGPIRLGFAQGGVNDIQEMAQRLGMPADAINPPTPAPTTTQQQPAINPSLNLDQIRAQLLEIGQRVQQELLVLNNTAHELQALNFVVNELARLRQLQQQQQLQGQQTAPLATPAATGGGQPLPPPPGTGPAQFPLHAQQTLPPIPPQPPFTMFPGGPPVAPQIPSFSGFPPRASHTVTTVTRHGGAGYGTAIPAGSPDLPEGVVIPPGWSLLPLQRLDGAAPPAEPAAPNPPPFPAPFQEMLESLAPQVRPPRGAASPAGAQGSEQADRDGATNNGSVLEATQNSGTQGSTSSNPLEVTPAHPVAPTVTAPSPVAPPNWGDSSLLFGGSGSRAPPLFGYQRVAGTPTPQDESVEGSSQPPAAPSAASAADSTGDRMEEDGQDMNGSSSANTGDSKGKARAAAVEDADDEDDDSS